MERQTDLLQMLAYAELHRSRLNFCQVVEKWNGLLYAICILCCHGAPEQSLKDAFETTVSLDHLTIRTIATALVSTRLDYANSILYGIPAKHISRLQRSQNTSHVLGKWYTDSSPSILKELHWLPIDARIKFKIATLTFKALNTGNPPYLANLLHWHTPCRTLQSASANLLSVTWCNLSFGTHGFRTAAPTIWNSLPANVCSVLLQLSTFRRHLKSHLFQSSFSTA